MQCNLCGKEGILESFIIESVEMQVCSECSKLGTRMQVPKTSFKRDIQGTEEFLTDNFSKLIKQARERKNLKQEDVARQLAMKESLLHKIENGSFRPSLRMAKRLEKFFNISITENFEQGEMNSFKTKSGAYTLADMMNN